MHSNPVLCMAFIVLCWNSYYVIRWLCLPKSKGKKSLLFKYCFTELISGICLKYERMEFFLFNFLLLPVKKEREENGTLIILKKSPPWESLEQTLPGILCFTSSVYFHCTVPGLKPGVNSVALWTGKNLYFLTPSTEVHKNLLFCCCYLDSCFFSTCFVSIPAI